MLKYSTDCPVFVPQLFNLKQVSDLRLPVFLFDKFVLLLYTWIMPETYQHYVMDEDTDARLCKDGQFRIFAQFGTFPECVRVYRQKGWALKQQDRFERNGRKTYVLSLPFPFTMNAAGHICGESSECSGESSECSLREWKAIRASVDRFKKSQQTP